MPLIFLECPPSNGVAFLLGGTVVLGSLAFGESIFYGKEL